MNRIVLVSDPTKEFPTNTTSSFKVRLPVPLELKGEGWNVGLAAISTPDAALDLSRLTNAVNPRVFIVGAKLVNSLRADAIPVHQQTVMLIKDLLHDPGVMDGVSLMKVLIRKSQFYEMKEAQAKGKRLYDRFRVTYEWDGEDLRMLAKELDDISLTTGMSFVQWHVHVSMAKLMGWLVETGKDKYALGPNLRYELIYKMQQSGNYYRGQKHGAQHARPVENRKRPLTVESDHQLTLQQLERRLPRGGGGALAHFSGVLGPGGQQYRRRPTACAVTRSGVPAPRPGRGLL